MKHVTPLNFWFTLNSGNFVLIITYSLVIYTMYVWMGDKMMNILKTFYIHFTTLLKFCKEPKLHENGYHICIMGSINSNFFSHFYIHYFWLTFIWPRLVISANSLCKQLSAWKYFSFHVIFRAFLSYRLIRSA